GFPTGRIPFQMARGCAPFSRMFGDSLPSRPRRSSPDQEAGSRFAKCSKMFQSERTALGMGLRTGRPAAVFAPPPRTDSFLERSEKAKADNVPATRAMEAPFFGGGYLGHIQRYDKKCFEQSVPSPL